LDPSELKEKLVDRFDRREQSDLNRLQLVVDLVNHEGCKTGFLLDYFGENLETDCGHCSYCLGGINAKLTRKETESKKLGRDLAQKMGLLQQQHPQALETPRQITRFLCGLSSPMLTKNKLTRNELFGWIEHCSFARIIEWVSTNV